MNNQIEFSDLPPKQEVLPRYATTTWRRKLQRYCDKMSIEKGDTTGYCVCGHMSYCDYCEETGKCVNAILALARDRKIEIDFNDYDFEKLLERI